MALPQLDVAPKYELTIPSNKQKVQFRPFLVKEQKVLMLAYESQDKRQIVAGMIDILNNCIDGDIDVGTLPTYDIDYMFTQIRAKSVGEKIDLSIRCPACSAENPISVDLDSVKIEVNEPTKIVKLTDQISIKLRYPDYKTFLSNEKLFDENSSQTDVVFQIAATCIESIMTEEDNISAKDEPIEDIIQFIESMNADQFMEISNFVQEMPIMSHDVDIKCHSCGNDFKQELRGLDDFF